MSVTLAHASIPCSLVDWCEKLENEYPSTVAKTNGTAMYRSNRNEIDLRPTYLRLICNESNLRVITM